MLNSGEFVTQIMTQYEFFNLAGLYALQTEAMVAGLDEQSTGRDLSLGVTL